MRSTRLLTGAALSAAALGLSTSAAFAGDFGAVEASPSPARPGSTASLSTTDCGSSHSASVDAGTLGAGDVTLTPGASKGSLVGELKIKPGTEQGNYGIGGECENGKEITGTVNVGARSGAREATGGMAKENTGTTTGGTTAGKTRGATGTTTGGATAGGTGGNTGTTPGGTATGGATAPKGKVATGTGTTSQGSHSSEIAAGAGALLAGAGACIWVLRRRRADGRA
ncbi:hypothetical protein [Streptomyces sp. NPDC093589]|uniref:hypothetical protein n=1 Tax=Streptomyces sp. NPDC093589 TaxID=3366043 RepID=UPI0037F6FDC6